MPAPPRSESALAVEATAPCRVDLAGGVVAAFSEELRPVGAVSVGLAIDRRPYCRLEKAAAGVRVESKDAPLKIEARSVAELPGEGVAGLVRHVLLALRVETGLQVVTQARVPFDAGLGSAAALAVAIIGAGSRLLGRELAAEDLPALVRGVPGSAESGAALLAAWGGVAAAAIDPGAGVAGERLRVDPARAEECLLLVDPGSAAPGPAAIGDEGTRAALAEVAAGAHELKAALVAGRASAVADLVAAEHQAWVRLGLVDPAGPVEKIARLVRTAGGAARPCGQGPKSLVLVWAEPGERRDGPKEAVVAALKAGGYRTFPCRLDVRGLEVEEA